MKQFEFKGTPGKWHLSIPRNIGKWSGFNTLGGKCYGVYATNEDLEAIAIIPKDEWLIHKEQNNKANALLISKAPEMLEMLKNIFNDYDYAHDNRKQIEQLLKEATEL